MSAGTARRSTRASASRRWCRRAARMVEKVPRRAAGQLPRVEMACAATHAAGVASASRRRAVPPPRSQKICPTAPACARSPSTRRRHVFYSAASAQTHLAEARFGRARPALPGAPRAAAVALGPRGAGARARRDGTPSPPSSSSTPDFVESTARRSRSALSPCVASRRAPTVDALHCASASTRPSRRWPSSSWAASPRRRRVRRRRGARSATHVPVGAARRCSTSRRRSAADDARARATPPRARSRDGRGAPRRCTTSLV